MCIRDSLYICDENYHRLSTQRIEGGLPFTMAEDTLGYKWLGTKGAGLFLFSERGDRLIEKYMLPNSCLLYTSSKKFHSWIIFRLGEFYLNYAEAMFRYTGDVEQALPGDKSPLTARQAINVIRDVYKRQIMGFLMIISLHRFLIRMIHI